MFDRHYHYHGSQGVDEVTSWFTMLEQQQNLIIRQLEEIMATIQDLTAAVQKEQEVEDSVLVLLSGVSQQLKDAKAANDPAAIDKVIAQIDANRQKLADAVAANTPSA